MPTPHIPDLPSPAGLPDVKSGLPDTLPTHVAIVMDGNGRWAKQRHRLRGAGHVAGAQVFRTIARYAEHIGLKYLTVFAFSTENWRRPTDEVGGILRLFKSYLEESLRDFKQENIRVCFLGDRAALAADIRALMERVEADTAEKTGLTLCIALNYGARAELTRAARRLAEQAAAGALDPAAIDEDMVAGNLYTKDIPDPDLVLRPSGEHRLSNFLLWQSAYAEFVFMDILWPDFTSADFDAALREYAARNRRFGTV
ncbi:MAG: isoprenyl transferase [Oscillospiraceae bacterium]|nr:isoprenyl transferase [Oscillospiraceae bacterium]